MEITLLSGEKRRLNLANYDRRKQSRSKFQQQVGDQLRSLFPYDAIAEEVAIPGEHLIFDFMVPSQNLVIECQGRQHDQYVPFFHGDRVGFDRHKIRDQRKRSLCAINGWTLICVPADYDVSQLVKLIDEARGLCR